MARNRGTETQKNGDTELYCPLCLRFFSGLKYNKDLPICFTVNERGVSDMAILLPLAMLLPPWKIIRCS